MAGHADLHFRRAVNDAVPRRRPSRLRGAVSSPSRRSVPLYRLALAARRLGRRDRPGQLGQSPPRPARYQPDASFRTYLYQIARNRLLDLLRQQQPLLAAEMGTGTDGTDAFDALADGAQDVVTPETALDEKQRY
ncbi:hypothetical protein LP420_02430 [Massilia sp. B-10]|nr:hypothetical protein LP420_02430 [Massilia sp. B-10]